VDVVRHYHKLSELDVIIVPRQVPPTLRHDRAKLAEANLPLKHVPQ